MITVTRTSSFNFDSDEYRALYQRSEASAFQHPEWLTAFYRHLTGGSRGEPHIIVGRIGISGELAVVIPLVRRVHGDTVVVEYACGDVTDYACPVVHSGILQKKREGYPLSANLVEVLGGHDILRIGPVRQRDVAVWRQLLASEPKQLDFGSHEIRYQSPYSQWRTANLGQARCSQIDRKTRRLMERGAIKIHLETVGDAANAMSVARHLRRGRFCNDPIQRAPVLDFYREVASTGSKSGFARTYRLSCGGDTVAVCFGLVDGCRLCYLVLACDYGTYARYSPGTMVLDMVMAAWAADGGKMFDFTIGDELYKNSFRCNRTRMFMFSRANTRNGMLYLERVARQSPGAKQSCRSTSGV